jgi:hypothetical protein
MSYLFGATVYSPAQARGNAVSTVERAAAAGSTAYLLASVSGDLATPALEILKSSFFQLSVFDAAAARSLCAGVPRSIVEAVALLLLVDAPGRKGQAYAATSGAGRVYRQRGAELREVTGGIELLSGDSLVASNQDLAGLSFLPTERAEPAGFRNDTLDADLIRALEKAAPRYVVAVSAVHALP